MNTENQPKSATITLRASGSTMRLIALRKADGTVATFVTTTDADKKTVRGLTEQHADMPTAKAHVATLAAEAEKLGWARSARVGFVPKPDAFSAPPAAPKATKAK